MTPRPFQGAGEKKCKSRAIPPLRLKSALSLGGLTVFQAARRTWLKSQEQELMTRAAAIAFYAMLALVPFLAIVLTLAVQLLPDVSQVAMVGQVKAIAVGNQAVQELETTLRELFPPEATDLILKQIQRLQGPEVRLDVLSLGLLVSLWLASTLFVAVIDAMNAVHGVEETRPFWRLRLVAILMTVVQAVILLGALLAIVAWPQIMDWIGWSDTAARLATAVQWIVLFVMVLLSFALTFYVAPDAEVRWEWITPGSLLGTIVFLLSALGFRAYVQNFANYNETYGSLGGVMILLFWFWLSAYILLMAGQLNRVIEDASPIGMKTGQRLDPTEPPDFEHLSPKPFTGPAERC